MITLFNLFVPTCSVWYVILFGKRVWFTESYIVLITSFLLLVLFTQFVDKIKKACCIKLKNEIIFYQNMHSHLYSHLHHTRT